MNNNEIYQNIYEIFNRGIGNLGLKISIPLPPFEIKKDNLEIVITQAKKIVKNPDFNVQISYKGKEGDNLDNVASCVKLYDLLPSLEEWKANFKSAAEIGDPSDMYCLCGLIKFDEPVTLIKEEF